VQTQHAYGGGYENFILRGFLQSPVSYRNGIRIPISRIELANAERVEVLKGPAAMLYGQADPGGLVNVVTKSPTSGPEYALQQGIGSYDFYRTEASASGPVTADAALRYRLDFSYLNGETFRDLSDNERIFIAPAFAWQVTPTTLVNLSYQHADDSLVYDSGTPAVGTGLADIPIERSFTQPGLIDDHQNDLIEFNVTQSLSERWKLLAGVTAFRNEKEFNEFYFFANLAPGDRTGERYAWFGGEELTTYTAWGNLVGEFDTGSIRHRLLLGVERFDLGMDSEATDQFVDTIDIFTFDPEQSDVDVTPFEISAPDFVGNQDNTANAVYIQDQLTILDNLHLMGGLRYDSLERELEAAYFSPLVSSSRDDSSVSPRAGMVYQPLAWLALYGSYAESFGPGSGYEASQLPDPEEAEQYEVGLKTDLLGGRLTSTLAFYDLTKSNILTPDPNNPAFSVAIGEARSRGVELDVQASLQSGWSLVGTYAYTDTEILVDGSGNAGNVLPYAARHRGSLWLKHDFQGEKLRGLSAGAGIYATGKRYGDAANSYADDGYARLDLFTAYRTRLGPSALIAQLNINNVTDTEYYNLRTRWSNLPAEPLTVLGTIRLEY
jgi:iron complex outermembrane receptor protein